MFHPAHIPPGNRRRKPAIAADSHNLIWPVIFFAALRGNRRAAFAGLFVLLGDGRGIDPADILRAPLGARSLSSWLGGRGGCRRLGGLGTLPDRVQRTGEPLGLDPVRRVEVVPFFEHLEREVVEHP
jgi:hypothetical protein